MKYIYVISFLLIILKLNAQSGRIIHIEYKTVKAVTDANVKIDPQLKKALEKHVEAVESIEFELFANDSIALFMKKEKLNTENQNPISKIIGNGTYFINSKQGEKIKQVDMLGEKFNIIYPFSEYKWEITQETKEIGGYQCYKAITHKEVYSRTRDKLIVTNPEVWFTPEIPLSYGPFGLNGLPGLILEATLNGKLYYYATKVDLDYKEKINSKLLKPSKGKYVSESEMESIQIKMFSVN